MQSTLPNGAIVKFRSRGRDELWQVHGEPGTNQTYSGIPRPPDGPKAGDTVYRCVWKGDRLEVRSAYVLQKDIEFKPAFDRPPDGVQRMPSFMAAMMSGLGAGNGFVVVSVVIDGHNVSISNGGTSIGGGGWGWSWLTDEKVDRGDGSLPGHQSVTFSEDGSVIQNATDDELRAFAQQAIDKMHSQSPAGHGLNLCSACHPPLVPVEVK